MSEENELPDISLDPVYGWLLVGAGLALLVWGAVFDATMASDGLYGAERIINMGELAKKLMILGAGGFITLAGIVFLVAFTVRSDLRRIAQSSEPKN